jgi:hypothetical protein
MGLPKHIPFGCVLALLTLMATGCVDPMQDMIDRQDLNDKTQYFEHAGQSPSTARSNAEKEQFWEQVSQQH